MKDKKEKQITKTLSFKAIISSLISIAFCAFLVSVTIINRTNIDRLRLEQQLYERAHRISESISKPLYKTEALAAVIQNNGSTDSFDIIAPSLADDPVIQNVILAPDGIVTKVYPLAGNEKLIGWNYFDDGAGNMEAMLARDTGRLVLGGPIDIVQGGRAIFGRLPVFINTPEETRKFWGLVSVTLKFPQILEYADLNIFDTYGYAYELWRISPDTNEKQIIANNYDRFKPSFQFVEKPVQILGAQWYLSVSLNDTWYNHLDNIAFIMAGFLISLIVFFVMQSNSDLKNTQIVFEMMAITDHLTGIFNRRHFLDIVNISIEKSRRHNEDCYLIMFDIDKFKNINDTYGHQIGDRVLMDVSARIKTDIRPYDLFARYGGEEFIIFTSGINKKDVCDMVERLRLSLCDKKYEYDNVSFSASASFGIAHMHDYNLNKAIKQSDDAMYAAKRNGRNCVVYFSEIES